MKRRSWLVVPASHPEALHAASSSGADVVVVDLVEFVAVNDRALARSRARESIAALHGKGIEAFAQIDPTTMAEDVAACIAPELSGIVMTRTESPDQVRALAALLDQHERAAGMPQGAVAIVPALETASGNHFAYDIACASPRVWGMTLGRADLVMDLRPEPSGELHLMPYLMQRLVVIAGAAGKVPLGAWWRAPDRGLLATAENTYEAAVRGRAIGFRGALCIEAGQVASLNKAYG